MSFRPFSSDFKRRRRGEAGQALLLALCIVGFLGLVGSVVATRATQLGQYSKTFVKLRQANGAFQQVQNLSECSRLTTCGGAVKLYTLAGTTPVVDTPYSAVAVGSDSWNVRASCHPVGSKKRVTIEMQSGAVWREMGAYLCD